MRNEIRWMLSQADEKSMNILCPWCLIYVCVRDIEIVLEEASSDSPRLSIRHHTKLKPKS